MATTLSERLAELAAQEELVLPVDHDRRGFYVLATDDPPPPRSDDAAPRRPYIRV
jgi:hypothetical protein